MRRIFTLLVTLVVFGASTALAQTKQVSGKVTSAEDNQPIPGANVFVKEAPTVGATADIDGNYSLKNVPANAKTIVFRFIGYTQVEMPIASTVNAALASENQRIDEVVVTALGQSKQKKALGYASASFGGDEISSTKVINPMNALQGKVAGVDISSAPGPGSTQNVIVRGASSFGNNQPLYIVDGVPITNSQNRSGDNLNNQVDFGSGINALNPDDIKDMTVLKGAAATALYGSRAANGVIMITTKAGQNTDGKMKVSYDGSFSVARVSRLPKEQDQFGQGWSGDRALAENGNWGAAFDGKNRLWGNVVDGQQQYKEYSYIDNRVRDFYDLGIGFKNAVSLYGGNETTNYYASFSQNKQDGVIPTDKDSYDRYTISTRGQHKGKYITIGTSVNFSTENNKAVASGQGSSVHQSLYEIPNDISIVDLEDYNNKFNNLDNYFTPYGVNPYYLLNENGAEQTKNKLFGKVQLDAKPFENFTLTYRFGGDYEVSTSNTHEGVVSFSEGTPNASSSSASVGSYAQDRKERVQLNHDFIANYNVSFTDLFKLNAVAGFNVNERKFSRLRGEIKSIDVNGFYYLGNSLSQAVATQDEETRRLVGLYGNLDFSYDSYAFLTLTARNDWSSTLPQDNNSYFYPGATLSFIATDFLNKKGIETGFVDFAKVRAAYGMTGNDANTYYIYDRYVAASSNHPDYSGVDDLKFPIAGVNAYGVSNQLGNQDLKPELTTEFEIGAEMKFFNYRFGFDFSYYNRFTKGLIEVLPIDPSSGYTQQIANLGDVRNSGIELTIDVTPVKLGDFRWDLSWNFAKNKNKVEKLDVPEVNLGGYVGVGIYAVEGMPLGQFKSTTVETVDIDGNTYTVVDGKGNPKATTDEVYLGKDINEKYRMGLTSIFTYKGLSLSGTFDFRYGGYMFSKTKDYMHWTGSGIETVLNDRNPFLVPNSVVSNGDGTYSENTTQVDPTDLHTFYSDGGFEGQSFAIIDKSYLKLRNVTLSYDLPSTLCKKIMLTGLTVSANVSNILLWTPADNQYIDPETTTFGNDVEAKFGEFNANPANQYYTLGLSFKF